MIEVSALTPALESAYSAFVDQQAHRTIYHTLAFRQFLAQALGATPQYLIAHEDTRIVGVLPCFEATHTQHGKVLNSLPWYGSHGGCLVLPNCAARVRHALLQAYAAAAAQEDVLFATMILPLDEQASAPEYAATLRPNVVELRNSQVTHLPAQGPDAAAELEATLWQKTRNLVRKARKQDFELGVEDDDAAWEFLGAVHAENMAMIGGRAKPRAHFQALRATIPREWRQLFVAKLADEPVAAVLLLRHGMAVEYLTPVIRHEFRSRQPLSFLIWHGMLQAIRDGFRFWNWGGTWATQATLHHFKAGWGAQDQPYSYMVHAKPRALAALRLNRSALSEAYPFFYTYPYHLLDSA